MKKMALAVGLGIFVASFTSAQPFTMFRKVLFLGNSITYEGTFVSNIETVLTLKYKKPVQIINMGLPSETVSGLSEPGHADNRFPRPDLHERLSRVLALVKPDLVVASYGINDGIYLPFDEERFAKYRAGMRWLHDEVLKSGAQIIHVTAPFYDEQRAGNKGYAHTMDQYAAWLLSMKDSSWRIIDVYHPMKAYLEAHRKVDARFNLDGFALASDGVHPNVNGHWLMARTILVGMGEKYVASISSIGQFVASFSNGRAILERIGEKQQILKDAYLTAAGHKRPEMNKGLPVEEAEKRKKAIDEEISLLLK